MRPEASPETAHTLPSLRSWPRWCWRLSLVALCLVVGALVPALARAQECDDCREIKEALRTPQGTTSDAATAPVAPIVVYVFWGDGCPHCEVAREYLGQLAKVQPGLIIREYEVWHSAENLALLSSMAAKHGFEATSVPTIFIGDRHWIGFTAEVAGGEISAYIGACAASGCVDAGAGVEGLEAVVAETAGVPSAEDTVTHEATSTISEERASTAEAGRQQGLLAVPVLGTVDLGGRSLVASTALIAFVDGFNPCSLWVLSLLLALTLNSGSRTRVLIIGLVFLTVTSLIYAQFIAGLFTVFTFVSFAGWIRVVVALVALFFALVNVKDYLWYKQGLSFTIGDERKPGLYRNMRRVLRAGDSLPALIGATVVMSAGASLVEFSCTAGFPVLWTNLLIGQQATTAAFLALLGLYMLIYQIDELAIFVAAVASLRASRVEEKHGRVLKLVGGMLMLMLALVMLAKPELMNELGTSLLLFLAAFAAAALVLLLHRVVLPRLGIRVGSEAGLGGRG